MAECRDNGVAQRRERPLIGDVTGDFQRPPPAPREFRADLIDECLAPARSDHIAARIGQAEREHAADAAGAADHHNRPADPRSGDLRHLREQGLVQTTRVPGSRDHAVSLTKEGRSLLESHRDRDRDGSQTFYAGVNANAFGFYLQGPGGTFYTQDSRNGGAAQALTYAGTGQNFGDWWMCFEDLSAAGGSDYDYDDAVLLLQSVVPTPTGAKTWGAIKALYR